MEMHFVAWAGCPLEGYSRLTVPDLLSYPFVLTEKGMSYRRLLDEHLAGLSLELKPILEIGSVRLLCSLVEQKAGLSFLPDYVTEDEVQRGRLIRLHVEDFEMAIWKQLLCHRDKWISPQLESVLQYCIEREFSGTL